MVPIGLKLHVVRFCFITAFTCTFWALLCLSEALLIKALLLTNFKYANRINEYFFSTFIFMVNIGFSIGSHLALYFLGSLESEQLLTGVKENPKSASLFYLMALAILFMISSLSLGAIAVKKFEAYWKDKKIVGNINIMIKNDKGQPKLFLNTNKHNKPLLNLFVLVLGTMMSIGFMLGYVILLNGSDSNHINSFWVAWAGNIFLRTIIPVCFSVYHQKKDPNHILKFFAPILKKF